MTFEVQQTRWDRIIRRVSGSIGPGSRVGETLSELFPVLDVERVPGELLRLGGTFISFGGGSITSVAGQVPTAQLFNPADSGNLVTITSVRFSCGADTVVRWGISLAALGTAIGTERFRDTRDLVPQQPIAQVRQQSAVAFANAINQSQVLAGVDFKIQGPDTVMVLAPGTGFEIGSNQLVSTIFYGFEWRERAAEESELSL